MKPSLPNILPDISPQNRVMSLSPSFMQNEPPQISALFAFAAANDIVEKSSGGVYKYKGSTLCRGEEKFQKLMEEDDSLRRKLLRKANINTIGTTKKRIQELNKNYFPVEGVEYESYNMDEENEDE